MSVIQVINPIAALRAYLIDSVPLVVGRVYTERPQTWVMEGGRPLPALIIQQIGGDERGHIPLVTTRTACTAYGRSSQEAVAVQQQVSGSNRDAFGLARGIRMVRGRWRLFNLEIMSPSNVREPESQWPICQFVIVTLFDLLEGAA